MNRLFDTARPSVATSADFDTFVKKAEGDFAMSEAFIGGFISNYTGDLIYNAVNVPDPVSDWEDQQAIAQRNPHFDMGSRAGALVPQPAPLNEFLEERNDVQIKEADWNGENPWYHRDIKWEKGLTENRAKALYEKKQGEDYRNALTRGHEWKSFITSQAGATFGDPIFWTPMITYGAFSTAARVMYRGAKGALNLKNAATVARYATKYKHVPLLPQRGVGALAGRSVLLGADAAINTLVFESALKETRARHGSHNTTEDILINSAVSFLAGGMFKAVQGGVGIRRRAIRDRQLNEIAAKVRVENSVGARELDRVFKDTTDVQSAQRAAAEMLDALDQYNANGRMEQSDMSIELAREQAARTIAQVNAGRRAAKARRIDTEAVLDDVLDRLDPKGAEARAAAPEAPLSAEAEVLKSRIVDEIDASNKAFDETGVHTAARYILPDVLEETAESARLLPKHVIYPEDEQVKAVLNDPATETNAPVEKQAERLEIDAETGNAGSYEDTIEVARAEGRLDEADLRELDTAMKEIEDADLELQLSKHLIYAAECGGVV